MEEKVVEAVVNEVKKNGFSSLEIGLALVGIATIGMSIYKVATEDSPGVAFAKDLSDGVKEELADLFK